MYSKEGKNAAIEKKRQEEEQQEVIEAEVRGYAKRRGRGLTQEQMEERVHAAVMGTGTVV